MTDGDSTDQPDDPTEFVSQLSDDAPVTEQVADQLDKAEDALCGQPRPVDAYKFIDRAQQLLEEATDDDL